VKKTPAKKKIKKSPEQRTIDLFRREITKEAKATGNKVVYARISTALHVKEIAKRLHMSLDDTVALCSHLHNRGVLRFAGDMEIPETEWHWLLKEWTITSWDEEKQKPRHLA
jgi:hypothetical protein